MTIREILEQQKIHFQPINPYDALRLYNVKKSPASDFLKFENRISKFSFLFSDGVVAKFLMILDAPKIEKEFYDALLKHTDNYVMFTFWRVENGVIFFHRISHNERMRSTDGNFYVLDMHRLNPNNLFNLSFYLLDSNAGAFEKKLLAVIKENLNAEIFVDDLARATGVSPNKVGMTLQSLGILTQRIHSHGKQRRKIINSPESLKTICDRAISNL